MDVNGEVKCPRVFSLDALLAMPKRELVVDIHCVTRWSKLAVRFQGVPLVNLITVVEPTKRARFVSFVARTERNHSTSLALDQALSLDCLVAFEAEGRPLATEHGGPVRLIVPQRYFYKSLKWLSRIELLAEDRLGYWERTAGYHNGADPWREQRYIASRISKGEAAAILTGRDLRRRKLLGLVAEGRDLAGLRAERSVLRDANFSDCSLVGACFDGANLSNAHFERACLQGASFRGADLDGANFAGADLRSACLLADSMVAASFSGPAVKSPSAGGAQFDESTQFATQLIEQLTPVQQAYVQAALKRNQELRNAD